MKRRRISVTHADNDDAPRLHHAGYGVGKLLRVEGIDPLGQVRHLLLIVARQQRVALHRVAVIGERHSALAQGAQLVAHVLIFLIAQPLKQTAHRGFRHPAQLSKLGAVVANQIVKMVEYKVRHPLLLRRQRRVLCFQTFI
ncbi:Uncharacterised protein [Klebsiella pneumoniae]|nr:Uncharacterised protein [Klebsiella pneumoniae]